MTFSNRFGEMDQQLIQRSASLGACAAKANSNATATDAADTAPRY